MKLHELETLAREWVGDGEAANVFFVTDGGTVVTVTQDFDVAYDHWRKLAARDPLRESALEDRQIGTLASVEPVSDAPGARLRVADDTDWLRRKVT